MSIKKGLWAQSEVDKMLKLKAAGHPWKHIAAVLNRSFHSCQQKMKEMKNAGDVRADLVTKEAKGKYRGGVNDAWPEADLITLYEMRRAGVPYKLVAQELCRAEAAIRSKYIRTNWKEMPFYSSDHKLSDKMRESKMDAIREKIANAYDRKFENHRMSVDILADELARSVKPYNKIKPPVYKPTRKRGKKRQDEDVVLLFSDIHIGAEHSFEETGGLTEFNQEVMTQRLQNLKFAVRDIHELHSQMYDLPRLNIACLGDLVAGMNEAGEWSQTHIAMSVLDQAVEGWNIISEMIAYWLGIFDQIVFYGVRGNHGRTAKKGVEKDYVNWDYIAYLFLQQKFSNHPRVKFVCPKTWWIFDEIKGHNFLMVHGDDVRSKGMPVRGLLDFEQKMSGIIGKIPDYTLAGHYHNSSELTTNRGRCLINGSVLGGDIYSLKDIHACSPPEQTIFGVHMDHGMTWKYNINLDHPRSES